MVLLLADFTFISQEVSKDQDVILDVGLLQPECEFVRDFSVCGSKTETRCFSAAFGAYSGNLQPQGSQSSVYLV